MYLIDLCICFFFYVFGIFCYFQLFDDGVEVVFNDGLQWEVFVFFFEVVVGDVVLWVIVGMDFICLVV